VWLNPQLLKKLLPWIRAVVGGDVDPAAGVIAATAARTASGILARKSIRFSYTPKAGEVPASSPREEVGRTPALQPLEETASQTRQEAEVRKLIVQEWMTLDGVVQTP
jgi:hypothetical protein